MPKEGFGGKEIGIELRGMLLERMERGRGVVKMRRIVGVMKGKRERKGGTGYCKSNEPFPPHAVTPTLTTPSRWQCSDKKSSRQKHFHRHHKRQEGLLYMYRRNILIHRGHLMPPIQIQRMMSMVGRISQRPIQFMRIKDQV